MTSPTGFAERSRSGEESTAAPHHRITRPSFLALVSPAKSAEDDDIQFVPKPITEIKIEERPLDLDGKPGFEALEIHGEVVLDTTGRYELFAMVQPDARTPSPWAFWMTRDELDHSLRGEVGFLNFHEFRPDSLGRVAFTLYFDGDDIWNLRRDGPWAFECRFLYLDNIDPVTNHPPHYAWIEREFEAVTRAYKFSDFSHRGDHVDPPPFRCGNE